MSRTEPTDEELLAKADKMAANAETLRAKGDREGADRAAGAAQVARDFVARSRLAQTEADNYARTHDVPAKIEE